MAKGRKGVFGHMRGFKTKFTGRKSGYKASGGRGMSKGRLEGYKKSK